GTLGPRLAALFTAAVRCGRRARSETSIARRAVSISHAAVALALEHFGDLTGKTFLLVGSGKMGEVAARQLHDAGAQHFIVANRSLERACTLARHYSGTPVALEEMPGRLAQVNAVISCTAAPHVVLTAAHITAALAARGPREPLLLIDLAVPRDIDPLVASLPGVRLYDIDSLQTVAERNLALRNGERSAAEAIVEEELAAFGAWVRTQSVVPTISQLHQTAERIRQAEVDKALRRLGPLGDREREIIDAMTRGIINKLLHEPTVRLKETAGDTDGLRYQRALSELFALDSGPNGHERLNGGSDDLDRQPAASLRDQREASA
ncbi:MAG TPA: glutamyl-tRNA reductase, partial [Chloroflexi bacterium]|nr:glutamyl-tRNA reductase [Chloroflexota bacterium]